MKYNLIIELITVWILGVVPLHVTNTLPDFLGILHVSLMFSCVDAYVINLTAVSSSTRVTLHEHEPMQFVFLSQSERTFTRQLMQLRMN